MSTNHSSPGAGEQLAVVGQVVEAEVGEGDEHGAAAAAGPGQLARYLQRAVRRADAHALVPALWGEI